MTEVSSSSIRTVIMDAIKTRFGGFTIWSRIETDIALMCSDLPDVTNEERRVRLVDGLKKIKDYLVKNGVEEGDAKFIDEEIDIHENTKQISLYTDEEDRVEKEIIDKYAHVGRGQEGIVAIHQAYNYTQLKKLTNGVYKRTDMIKFYISREKIIHGKVVAEIYEHPQKIYIAHLTESKKKDETGSPAFKKIFLFGEGFSKKDYNVIKSIDQEFYVYRIVTEKDQELMMFSLEKLLIGDYVITGVVTHCEDKKMLTETARLPTQLPILFAQNCRNRIIKFENHNEFRARLGFLKVSRKNLFDLPFTVKKGRKQYLLKQPKWFKWLVWSWLTHSPVGLFNNYPMHLMIVGEKHSGKSLMLNSLHERSQETRDIFSGSSSTLKHLIPSFKYNPARLGYLAESNRFSYCDEFLRCMMNTRGGADRDNREEGVAVMNDLLEHQKREAGSGVSRISVNMTSRIIATTNPIRGLNSMTDLVRSLDESFLSRWLIYYQPKEHVDLIRRSKDVDLKEYEYTIDDNDWVSILDYLHTFKCEYDMDRVEAVKDSANVLMNEDLKRHYDARHMHHIECLIDGIVKTRCLVDKDMGFKATEKDYEMLELVWKNIIKSWIDVDMVRNLPVHDRIFYLPENCQVLYWKINNKKKELPRNEVKEMALKFLKRHEYIETMSILLHHDVITDDAGIIRPHHMGKCRTK